MRSSPGSLLRLADRMPPRPRILFVGINPGMTSARVNHHFAGRSNRFWRLLYESGLTPELLAAEHDHRMMSWGYGLTNLVARATPGIDALRREDYVAGLRVLRRKVARVQPQITALVGVTLCRFVFARTSGSAAALGLQPERLSGSRVFLLPNPSGRNAHFSYDDMLHAFRQLAAIAAAQQQD